MEGEGGTSVTHTRVGCVCVCVSKLAIRLTMWGEMRQRGVPPPPLSLNTMSHPAHTRE
jgi:hypothetical protein